MCTPGGMREDQDRKEELNDLTKTTSIRQGVVVFSFVVLVDVSSFVLVDVSSFATYCTA
jgi:hypothetical protein